MLVDGGWLSVWKGDVIKTQVVALSMMRWVGSLLAKVSIHAVLGAGWLGLPSLVGNRKEGQKLALKCCCGCPMATEGAVDVPCMWALLPILHQCICSSRVCPS